MMICPSQILWLRCHDATFVPARVEAVLPRRQVRIRTTDDHVFVCSADLLTRELPPGLTAHLPDAIEFERRTAAACHRELSGIRSEAYLRSEYQPDRHSRNARNPPKLTADERAEMQEKRV